MITFARRFTRPILTIAVLFFGFSWFAAGRAYASAHSVDFTTDTTISGTWDTFTTVTALAGSQATSFVVDASTITVTVPANHFVILRSSANVTFANSFASTNCGTNPTLQINGTGGAAVVITPTNTLCSGASSGGSTRRRTEPVVEAPSGGGGGGGGTPPPATPPVTPPAPTVETPAPAAEIPAEAKKKDEKKVVKKTNSRAILKRTELLKMVAEAASKDVSVLKKYTSGKKTSDNVTHAEALKILFDAFGVKPPRKSAKDPYKDVKKNTWYAPYVEKAKSLGLLTDKTFKTKFSPSAKIRLGVLEGMLKVLQGQ